LRENDLPKNQTPREEEAMDNGVIELTAFERMEVAYLTVPVSHWISAEATVKSHIGGSSVLELGRRGHNMELCILIPTGLGEPTRRQIQKFCLDYGFQLRG
jgi:hypothetical protein